MPKNLTNVKEDILLVTRQLLKDEGYSNLSIRKIAAKCGVASGTVYNYYNSKNEIIVEILKNEWNLMLRKIDQNTKTLCNTVDKIENMFNELHYFMTNVHGFWFDTDFISNDTMSICSIKEKKHILRNQLSEKICSFFDINIACTDETKNICNTISVILIAYANEDMSFSNLKPSICALINVIDN